MYSTAAARVTFLKHPTPAAKAGKPPNLSPFRVSHLLNSHTIYLTHGNEPSAPLGMSNLKRRARALSNLELTICRQLSSISPFAFKAFTSSSLSLSLPSCCFFCFCCLFLRLAFTSSLSLVTCDSWMAGAVQTRLCFSAKTSPPKL